MSCPNTEPTAFDLIRVCAFMVLGAFSSYYSSHSIQDVRYQYYTALKWAFDDARRQRLLAKGSKGLDFLCWKDCFIDSLIINGGFNQQILDLSLELRHCGVRGWASLKPCEVNLEFKDRLSTPQVQLSRYSVIPREFCYRMEYLP
jgi:hypothetical protein